MIVVFIVIAFVLLFVLSLYFYVRVKTKNFLKEYFDASSFREAFEKSEYDTRETPKSISSMDSVYLTHLKDDFPGINVNELKSMAENCILDVLNAVEIKNVKNLTKYPGKIVSYAEKLIEDTKGKQVSYDNIKIHKTAITTYGHDKVTATVTFSTALEYICKKEGDKAGKKVQDRFKTEVVYVIDAEKYGKFRDSIGINCPNCGAPIMTLGEKKCAYCGTTIMIITKNAWIVNNIKQD